MPDPTARAALIEAMAYAISESTLDWGDDPVEVWDGHRQEAETVLAVIEAHAGGCCVVPVDASDAERDACGRALQHSTHATLAPGACWQDLADVAHSAMLAASPYAPPQQEDKA